MIESRKVVAAQLKQRGLGALLAVAFGVLTLIAGTAASQQYPSKPIKIIVPYSAGGTTDVVARTVGKHLSERLKQPVVIENRPGASALMGTEYVGKSAADGYTLEYTVADPFSILPHLSRKIPYDALKDFSPVAMTGSVPIGLVVSANVPANSIVDLMRLAKERPGKLSYASWGVGSGSHIRMEAFKAFTKIDLLHVPYQGSGPAFAALAGGHVDLMMVGVGLAEPNHKAGKVKILAVDTTQRYPSLPEVPTLTEQDVPLNLTFWNGLIAPANVPEPIIALLNKEVNATLMDPQVRQELYKAGFVVGTPGVNGVGVPPQDVRKFFEDEYTRWGKIIRDAKIAAE